MKLYKANHISKHFIFFVLLFGALIDLKVTNAQNKTAFNSYPNILIITMDNIGYGDLPVYNEDSPIVAPNIDKLAEEGMRFTSFYTASPTCTASRAALLTGRIPQRNGLDYQLVGLYGNYGEALRRSEVIIPEILKTSAGNYATGVFGKWNIGFAPGTRPTERGFDEFLGIVSGNADHFSHVYKGKKDLHHNLKRINREGEYSTDLFANTAIEFIRKNTEQQNPWFVYLPFDAPHHPGEYNIGPDEKLQWQAPDLAFKPYNLRPDEKDPKKRFNAVVTAIDMAIGRVLNTLDELGIVENTFVFLYSDNGAFYPYINSGIQSNKPFNGAGVTLYEGGIRVPAIARWPSKIKKNSICDARLWSLDLLIACANLANAQLPTDRFLDGMDPVPVFTGERTDSPHETLFFEYRNYAALLWDDWKIFRVKEDEPWQLFNLKNDISERTDLSTEYPEIIKKMTFTFDHTKMEIRNYRKIEHTFNERLKK